MFHGISIVCELRELTYCPRRRIRNFLDLFCSHRNARTEMWRWSSIETWTDHNSPL